MNRVGTRSSRALRVAAGLCCVLAAPAAAQWAPDGTPIVRLPGDQVLSDVVSDGAGGAIVCWVDDDALGFGPRAKRITSAGQDAPGWAPEGVAITAPDSIHDMPSLLAAGGGGAFAGWITRLTDSTATVKVRRLYWDGAAADPVVYGAGAAIPLSPRFGDRPGFYPFIGWTTDSTGVTGIRLQRLAPSGDPFPGWPAAGVGLGGTRREYLARVVADDARGAYLLTYSFTGDRVNLFLYRADSSGVAPGWPDSGILVRREVGQVQAGAYPMIASAGGVIVAWWEYRAANADIYASRYLPDGSAAPGWPAAGLPICTETHHQLNPVLVTDGADGAIALWLDFRGPNEAYDLYAKRVLASGQTAAGWPADGAALCAARDYQYLLAAAPDGTGGVIGAWMDERFGAPDLFAQRLRADGSAAWAGDGIPLRTGAGQPSDARVVVDDAGNALFAWSELPGGGSAVEGDIYATRVSAQGGVGSPRAAPGVAAGPARPNPARGNITVYLELGRAQRVASRVIDVSGRTVRVMGEQSVSPGRTYLEWDGRDDDGREVRQGVYFIQFRAEDGSAATRVAVVR